MGGAMELAQKAKKVIVVMNHFDKNGSSKIVPYCTLPLTSAKCVDMIISELGVFEVTTTGLVLTEVFLPNTIQEVKKLAGCEVKVAESIRKIEY
jgi:acetate CoA/acetoacetate CoA-transferase beta subunit